MPSDKKIIIEYLYKDYVAGKIADGIVNSSDIIRAISATKSELSPRNPANFLKDIIRSHNANDNWPDKLKNDGISARQRYSEKKRKKGSEQRVFQFVSYKPGQSVPFPDRFLPDVNTPSHDLQSATVPSVARALGRPEESWLMQIVVALRVIETHLSLFSPMRDRLDDVTHLQMSQKTQPEVDAVYLLSYSNPNKKSQTRNLYYAATCEAKQHKERILEDQIREQVAVVLEQSTKIKHPPISAVVPLAIQVREDTNSTSKRKGIFIVEFQPIERTNYETLYKYDKAQPERLYDMPLVAASKAFYRLLPSVKGIDA